MKKYFYLLLSVFFFHFCATAIAQQESFAYQDADISYQEGINFQRSYQWDKAELAFKKAYDTHPKEKYLHALAEILLINHQLDSALYLVPEQGLGKQDTITKWNLRARAYALKNDLTASNRLWEKILTLDKQDPNAYVGLIDNSLAQKKYQQAQKWLHAFEQNNKDNLLLWQKTADIYAAQTYYDKAFTYYDKIATQDPYYFSMLLGKAKIFLEQGNITATLPISTLMQQYYSYKQETTYILAKIAFLQKDYDKALGFYKTTNKAITENNFYLPALKLIAESYEAQKIYAYALLFYKKYLSFLPKDFDSLYKTAKLHLIQGSTPQALLELQELHQTYPNHMGITLDYAMAFVQDYKMPEARKLLEDVIEKNEYRMPMGIPRFMLGYFCDSSYRFIHCPDDSTRQQNNDIVRLLSFYYLDNERQAGNLLGQIQTKNPAPQELNPLYALMEMRHNAPRGLELWQRSLTETMNHRAALYGNFWLLQENPVLENKIYDFLNKLYQDPNHVSQAIPLLAFMKPQQQQAYIVQITAKAKDPKALHHDLFWWSKLQKMPLDYQEKRLDSLLAHLKTKQDFAWLLRQDVPPRLKEKILHTYAMITKGADTRRNTVLLDLYVKQQDFNKIGHFLNYLQQNKQRETAYFNSYVRYLIHQKQFAKAEEQIKLVTLSRDNALFFKIIVSLMQNKNEIATFHLQTLYAQTDHPDYLIAIYDLLKHKNAPQASAILENYYPKTSQTFAIRLTYAGDLFKRKEYLKAEKILSPLKQEYFNHADFLALYGQIRFYLRESDSEYYLRQAILYDTQNKSYDELYQKFYAPS